MNLLARSLIASLLMTGSVLAASNPATTAKFYEKHNHVVEIEIRTANWDNLRNQEPQGGRCNFTFTGDRYDWFHFDQVKIDGVTFKDVGVKKRSWCGSISSTKPSLSINVDKYNKANEEIGEKKLGVTQISLSNSVQDDTYVRQCLSYLMFAKAGVKAPRCNFSHVTVNGQDLGLYVNIQPYKKPFFKQNYLETSLGNIYEVEGANLVSGHLNRFEARLDSFKENEDKSLKDIRHLIYGLAKNDGIVESMKETINVNQVTRYWAMEILLAHRDGFSGNRNNSYLYFPNGGKMQILPWGADEILKHNDGVYTRSRLASKMYQQSEFRAGLKNRIDNFFATIWNEGEINSSIQAYAEIIYPYLNAEEKNGFWDRIAGLKQQVNSRRADLAGRY